MHAVGPPLNVGIVGCGTISAAYLKTLSRLEALRLTAVADIDFSRAQAVATTHAGVRALSPEHLMADEAVDLVLNLTIPAAHAEVALQAIDAGKSVYGEKPLATSTAEARKILEAATAANVRVGCAPDTVLGTGIQTARKAAMALGAGPLLLEIRALGPSGRRGLRPWGSATGMAGRASTPTTARC